MAATIFCIMISVIALIRTHINEERIEKLERKSNKNGS